MRLNGKWNRTATCSSSESLLKLTHIPTNSSLVSNNIPHPFSCSRFLCSPPDLNSVVTDFMFCLHVKKPLPQGDNPIAVNKYYLHHHMSVMELGHLLTRSGLTYLEVSSEVCQDSFCQLGNSVSLSWVVCHEAFCLHVVSSSSCIPAVYLEPVLFLIPLQCVNLFSNLSKCILLFFSCISSLLLLFSWHPLL